MAENMSCNNVIVAVDIKDDAQRHGTILDAQKVGRKIEVLDCQYWDTRLLNMKENSCVDADR